VGNTNLFIDQMLLTVSAAMKTIEAGVSQECCGVGSSFRQRWHALRNYAQRSEEFGFTPLNDGTNWRTGWQELCESGREVGGNSEKRFPRQPGGLDSVPPIRAGSIHCQPLQRGPPTVMATGRQSPHSSHSLPSSSQPVHRFDPFTRLVAESKSSAC
jgi:hypothetical protein